MRRILSRRTVWLVYNVRYVPCHYKAYLKACASMVLLGGVEVSKAVRGIHTPVTVNATVFTTTLRKQE